MAKGGGEGTKGLACIGGVTILLLAARVMVPMVPEPTSLLSFAAILLGLLVGWQEGLTIGLLAAGAMLLGVPGFIASGHFAPENPFALRDTGLRAGIAIAMAVAGRLAPPGQARFMPLLLAALAASAAALAMDALWLMRFDGWRHALYEGTVPHLIPFAVKGAAAALAALVLRRVM